MGLTATVNHAAERRAGFNDRLSSDPKAATRRFTDLLELDDERVRLRMFARAAAEPRQAWSHESLNLSRALA